MMLVDNTLITIRDNKSQIHITSGNVHYSRIRECIHTLNEHCIQYN